MAIALEWHRIYPTEDLIGINDISLPYGGKFDVNGNWFKSHQTHREGLDVDIRTELPGLRSLDNFQTRGIPVRTPRDATDWKTTTLIFNRPFMDICEVNNGVVEIHSPKTTNEHYHIDFNE